MQGIYTYPNKHHAKIQYPKYKGMSGEQNITPREFRTQLSVRTEREKRILAHTYSPSSNPPIPVPYPAILYYTVPPTAP